jgi:hypothetical protein
MGEKSLLEMYAAELMRVQERDLRRGRPKSASGNGGWGEKEWSEEDIADFKARIDKLQGEFMECTRLNITASPDHIANILYRNRYRHKLPDELWDYMVEKVTYWQDRIPDMDEMFERVNENDWWSRWRRHCERVAYMKGRSKRQSQVKNSDL